MGDLLHAPPAAGAYCAIWAWVQATKWDSLSATMAKSIVFLFALWMIGAVPMPIDFRTRPTERCILYKNFDLLVIIEDRQTSEGCGYVSLLVDDEWTEAIANKADTPFIANCVSTPAIISLTSGTTGRPLGVVLTHEQLLFRVTNNISLGGRRSNGRLLNPSQVSASSARNHSLSQLFDGATVYFYPPLFSPNELAELVLSKSITKLSIVPTILRGLFELERDRGRPLFEHLDLMYCFGAPILPEEKRRARSQICENMVEGYSSSVSGRISVLSGADIDVRPETVGRVLPHVELEVVDDDDQLLPIGVPGMIRVRSPGAAQSLLGAGERSSGDKLRAGWAYPGDIGAIVDGFLHLLGRSSDLIIRGGTNVYPSEVESVIAECKGVQDVAVVGFTKLPEGEDIAAFVVSSSNVTEGELAAYCRTRLTPAKRPRKFVFVRELPRNANGKLIRNELRRQLENGS